MFREVFVLNTSIENNGECRRSGENSRQTNKKDLLCVTSSTTNLPCKHKCLCSFVNTRSKLHHMDQIQGTWIIMFNLEERTVNLFFSVKKGKRENYRFCEKQSKSWDVQKEDLIKLLFNQWSLKWREKTFKGRVTTTRLKCEVGERRWNF